MNQPSEQPQQPTQPDKFWIIYAANGTLVYVRTTGMFLPSRQLANQYTEEQQRELIGWTEENEVARQVEDLQALGVMVRAHVYQLKR